VPRVRRGIFGRLLPAGLYGEMHLGNENRVGNAFNIENEIGGGFGHWENIKKTVALIVAEIIAVGKSLR